MRKFASNVAPKVVAAVMAAASVISMTSPALAKTEYAKIAGGSTSFKKYLIMSRGDRCPNVTFSYTVAAGEAVSTDTSVNPVFQVIPGPTPEAVTVSQTTFAVSDTESAVQEVTSGDIDVARAASARAENATAENGVEFEPAKGEKYVTKTATVDLSRVQFDEPGIYRYIITETASSADEAAGIMHDNDDFRILDVYVIDNGEGVLQVAKHVMHTDINATETPAIGDNMGTADVAAENAPLSDKTDGFTNEYKSKDLEFKKGVTGNQASRDKYFDFTLALNGLNPNGEYEVSIAADTDLFTNDGNADARSAENSATIEANANKDNVTKLTADGDGAVTQHFYLQHGQSIVVRGLPLNGRYELSENREDYKSTPAAVTDYTKPVTGAIGTTAGSDKVIKTSYLNTKSGNIPTGIIVSSLTGATVAGIGLASLVIVRRKKHEDEA